jgi:hypothetical protein
VADRGFGHPERAARPFRGLAEPADVSRVLGGYNDAVAAAYHVSERLAAEAAAIPKPSADVDRKGEVLAALAQLGQALAGGGVAPPGAHRLNGSLCEVRDLRIGVWRCGQIGVECEFRDRACRGRGRPVAQEAHCGAPSPVAAAE